MLPCIPADIVSAGAEALRRCRLLGVEERVRELVVSGASVAQRLRFRAKDEFDALVATAISSSQASMKSCEEDDDVVDWEV